MIYLFKNTYLILLPMSSLFLFFFLFSFGINFGGPYGRPYLLPSSCQTKNWSSPYAPFPPPFSPSSINPSCGPATRSVKVVENFMIDRVTIFSIAIMYDQLIHSTRHFLQKTLDWG